MVYVLNKRDYLSQVTFAKMNNWTEEELHSWVQNNISIGIQKINDKDFVFIQNKETVFRLIND
jgi:hypothetical protein